MKLTESSVLNLQALSLPQLQGIKHSLGKFFYQSGVNISFYSILKEEESIVFQNKIIEVIKRQLRNFIKIKNIINNKDEIKKNLSPFLETSLQQEKEISDFLDWIWKKGIEVALEKTELDLQKPKSNKILLERMDIFVENMDKAVLNWLFGVIFKAQSVGMTHIETMQYLSNNLSDTAQKKVKLVTAHEIMAVLTIAEYETYKFNRIKKMKWKVAMGEENEKDCLENEKAGEVNLGSDFPSGHKFPPTGHYCSCFLMPIRSIRQAQDKPVINYE